MWKKVLQKGGLKGCPSQNWQSGEEAAIVEGTKKKNEHEG